MTDSLIITTYNWGEALELSLKSALTQNSNFIENYILSAKPKTAVEGRKVELGEQYSVKLRVNRQDMLNINGFNKIIHPPLLAKIRM